jgi:tyrosyl-tRNA synthetase
VFSNYLTFGDGPKDAMMINNAEWLLPLNYLEFLRDVGRISRSTGCCPSTASRQRLDREQSLSFLEFNYMILQAYDFVELNKRYGCACRWAAPTSGATSSTVSTSATAWARSSSTR